MPCAGTVGRSRVRGEDSRLEPRLCLSKREVPLLLDSAALCPMKLSVMTEMCFTKEPRVAVEHSKRGWWDRGADF